MGLMDFFIRPEPVSYGTTKGLNTLQINRIAADLRTARDKVNNQMAKRELLEKQREAAVKVKTEAEERYISVWVLSYHLSRKAPKRTL